MKQITLMHKYTLKIWFLFIFSIILSCVTACAENNQESHNYIEKSIKSDSIKSRSIQIILNEAAENKEAPGIIAAIISSDGIIGIASAGERMAGSGVEFTINDKVHLGSCSKAMTSTMLATLVAEEKLSWDIKLTEAIPELKNRIHSDYHRITLWQLLTHRAGIPKNPTDWGAFSLKEIKARRLAILEDNLQEPATYEIDKFHYSNFGYMIAACMAEQKSGLSWEELMKERLFEPLGMSSAGFGAPNKHNQIDQPWGHSSSWLGNKWQSDQTDNPEPLGPAGRIHCSVEDWAKFLSLQLTTENLILEQRYLNKIIEPDDDHFYAGGWGIVEQPWANGIILTHNGSNAIWYSMLMVAPNLNRAFVVATNSCSFDSTPKLCNDIIAKLIRLELKINDQ